VLAQKFTEREWGCLCREREREKEIGQEREIEIGQERERESLQKCRNREIVNSIEMNVISCVAESQVGEVTNLLTSLLIYPNGLFKK
jgi:hypothetical protein